MDNSIFKNNNESTLSSTSISVNAAASSDPLENLKKLHPHIKNFNPNFIEISDASTKDSEGRPLLTQESLRSFMVPGRRTLQNFMTVTVDPSKEVAKEVTDRSLLEMGFNFFKVEGWEDIAQPPKANLYKLLRNMIMNHIKPNVQIRIGAITFNCHLMVLQCYSDFFLECHNEILVRLPEEKITPGSFMMVYDWMLADEPLVQREGILELFNAASFLRIKDLINQCWLCLDDDIRFREDTAFLLYLEARKYCLTSLEELMLSRISKFFLTLVASREFLMLDCREICVLFNSNTIGVNSEIEVFLAGIRWLNHDWPARKEAVLPVLRCVRFSLMPPWFLVTLSRPNESEEINRVLHNTEVKKLVNDGVSYTTTQVYYGDRREEFLHFLEAYALTAPMQRLWIYDRDCRYHHRIDCPNMEYISYRSFLDYLLMIQKIGKTYWTSLEITKDKCTKEWKCCGSYVESQRSIDTHSKCLTSRQCRDQSIQVASGTDEDTLKYAPEANLTTTVIESPETAHYASTPQVVKIDLTTTDLTHISGDLYMKRELYFHRNNLDEKQYIVAEKSTKYHMPIPMKIKPNAHTQVGCKRHCTKPNKHCVSKLDGNFGSHCPSSRKSSQSPVDERQGPHFSTRFTHRKEVCAGRKRALNAETVKTVKPPLVTLKMSSPKKSEFSPTSNSSYMDHGSECSLQQLPSERSILRDRCVTQTLVHCSESSALSTARLDLESPENLSHEMLSIMTRKQFSLMKSQKILIFGGVDPYCQHCLAQKEEPNQKQRKRVNFSDVAMTQVPRSKGEHDRGRDVNDTITNTSTGDPKPSFGDQVLIFDSKRDIWKHLAYLPLGSRHHHAAVMCNDLIYLIGGARTSVECSKKSVFEKTLWSFNLKTLRWIKEPSMPEPRRDFAAIAIERKCGKCKGAKDHRTKSLRTGILIIGGEGVDGVPMKSVWFYDVNRKLWLERPSLNLGRYGHTAVIINNEIWVAGGVVVSIRGTKNANTQTAGDHSTGMGQDSWSDKVTDTMEYISLDSFAVDHVETETDSTQTNRPNPMEHIWKISRLRLRIPRIFGRFCKLSRKRLYLVGGIGFSSDSPELRSLDSIDYFSFKEERWLYFAHLNLGRHGHDIAPMGDRIVVIGGVSTAKNRTLHRVEVFCTKTRKSINTFPNLPWPISGASVVTLD